MPNIVHFDCFDVDLDSGQLRKHGTKIRLRDQSFQVLASLLERPGRVVTREDLRQRLWHRDVFVDFDNNLNIVIARLREALGDSAEHPRFIETLPKHGYRFLAAVSGPARATEGIAWRPKLVVLPFLNLSGNPAQDYLGDAVTEELITALANLAPDDLGVIARTTAMHYKGSRKDISRIGHELHADYVVEGGIRSEGDEIGVNVQLIQTSDQTHLFARKYETCARDVFHLQARIAQEIARRIPALGESVGVRMMAVPPQKAANLASYGEYLQGRAHMRRPTSADFAEAKRHLEGSIAHDPESALAHDALAELNWYFGYFGLVPPRDAFSAGILHALRALEIDGTRAETHALLGQFHKTVDYDWPEVHREMALARQLDPNSPLVSMRYAVSELMPHGRVAEAAAELERALEFDPLSFFTRFWLGIMLIFCRRYDRAVEEARYILDKEPDYFLAYFVLAAAFRYQNLNEKAIAAQRKCVSLSGGSSVMLGWLGLTLAANGQQDEARDVLKKLHESAEIGYVPPTSFAWIHLGLREIDTAFEWLSRAVDECDQLMMPIKSYAFLDPIRSDPRFAILLRKMGLQPD